MSTNRMYAAALAAALALPASAQSGSIGERARTAAGGQPAAQPAPAPAQPQGQAQAGQPAPLTAEQRQALAELHYQNELAAYVGNLAATRASSNEVKALGQRLVQEHQRIDGQLATLLRARGADMSGLPAAQGRAQMEPQVRAIEAKGGDEFDREVVSFLTRNGVAFVDAAKRARDVTPGKDAELKKFLDDAENTEEAHLAAARQMKSQRQARTPPAR